MNLTNQILQEINPQKIYEKTKTEPATRINEPNDMIQNSTQETFSNFPIEHNNVFLIATKILNGAT